MPDQHDALGPEDDPYLAYLIWREERDAAARSEQPSEDEQAIAEPGRRSWVRRLAVWRRTDSDEHDR
ncbi:hypothetical protein [Agromyces bauzanensis]|uniref:hypothetical protein n=1 Tax=Agromyces bauzanensis TaxID=1308924 RepID=UPI0016697697|nr:hypothetical protein [Agromyces bauzanensis]